MRIIEMLNDQLMEELGLSAGGSVANRNCNIGPKAQKRKKRKKRKNKCKCHCGCNRRKRRNPCGGGRHGESHGGGYEGGFGNYS